MSRLLRVLVVAGALMAGGVAATAMADAARGTGAAGATAGPPAGVLYVEATGPVTPVMADTLQRAVATAERVGYQALLVRLDTPGGLVTAMRDIVKTFLNAPVPVVVHVAPAGASAASAGYVIATAAHVTVMTPGTNIGAATPIDLEGGEVLDKVVNDSAAYARAVAEARGRSTAFAEDATREGRSVAASQAVELDVVDLVAASRQALLKAVDGRKVTLANDRTVTLRTAGATVTPYQISLVRRLLQRVADPNLAFLLLSIGTLALLYELASPGLGAGAAVGVILIVLALFALSVLPINLAGVALVVLGLALFVAELFTPGLGVAAAGGVAALLMGGLFLFQRPTGIGVDLAVLLPTVLLAGLAVAGITVLAARGRARPSAVGPDQLVGRQANVRTTRSGVPQVFVDGAWWRVRSPIGSLAAGQTVRVVARDGLELIVEPGGPASSEPRPGAAGDKDRQP